MEDEEIIIPTPEVEHRRVQGNSYSLKSDDADAEEDETTASSSINSRFFGIIPFRMGNLSLISTPLSQVLTQSSGRLEAVERFNEETPANHSYLGDNLEEVSGRMIFSEERVVDIPLLEGYYAPLLPGQTFPLSVRELGRCEMLRACMEGDHTFGCISTRKTEKGETIYGTTAEIYEYLDEDGTICIKAKGRQRFKVISSKRDPRLHRVAEVFILPEVKLNHPFNSLNLSSLNGLRISQKEKCRKIESGLLVWPKWVYDMYDPQKLVEQAESKLAFLTQGLRRERGGKVMPKDPSELSFWVATHLDSQKKRFLLKLNSPISRLRWTLSYLSKVQIFTCDSCQAPIGKQADIFAMSIVGPQSTFINSAGHHHDTVTLIKADNIVPVSSPSTHYSWFPGYAWRIAVCRLCEKHLGWLFVATDVKLWPRKFWGLSRQSLSTQIGMDDLNKDPADQPVM